MIRRGSQAVAVARVAVGVTAFAWPTLPARPWVGATSSDLTARVFGRALGARDLALGLGTLNALRGTNGADESAAVWVAVGALSDALDVATTAASWRELPKVGRWLVAGSAAGAAVAGAVGAAMLAFGGSRNVA